MVRGGVVGQGERARGQLLADPTFGLSCPKHQRTSFDGALAATRHEVTSLNEAMDAAAEQASRAASAASIPDDIDRLVRDRLEEDPALAWDEAIASLAAEAFGTSP